MTLIGNEVTTVKVNTTSVNMTIWMIGFLNRTARSQTHMVAREAVLLTAQIVLPVNIQTFSNAMPLVSAFTKIWFVTIIHIQAVVGMMRALIFV